MDPLSPEEYQLFLATHQGVVHRGASMDALEERLELLFGYPAAASLWEEEILPARIIPYYPSWLDRAMAQSELVWFGCGSKRVSFAFQTDLDLFLEPRERDSKELPLVEPLRKGGRMAFLDLAREAGVPTDEATEALWTLVWEGIATNDTMESLRRGIGANFAPARHQAEEQRRRGIGAGRSAARSAGRSAGSTPGRGGYSRWRTTRPMSGNWLLLERPDPPADPVEEAELMKDRARLLLARYGILYRELLSRELPPFQWGRLFRSLRLMELSGEIVAGHFIDRIGGLQFASPEAIRELRRPSAEEAVYWINAADPASTCGLGIDERMPRRVASSHLVFQGTRLILHSKRSGKELEFFVPPEEIEPETHFALFRELLSREQRPLKRLRIEAINGNPPGETPYAAQLRESGFFSEGPYLTLYRRY